MWQQGIPITSISQSQKRGLRVRHSVYWGNSLATNLQKETWNLRSPREGRHLVDAGLQAPELYTAVFNSNGTLLMFVYTCFLIYFVQPYGVVSKTHTWVKVKLSYWKVTLVKVDFAYMGTTYIKVLNIWVSYIKKLFSGNKHYQKHRKINVFTCMHNAVYYRSKAIISILYAFCCKHINW